MIGIDRWDLVIKQNESESNTLHIFCLNKIPLLDVISRLLEFGGLFLLSCSNQDGYILPHCLFLNEKTKLDIDIVSK